MRTLVPGPRVPKPALSLVRLPAPGREKAVKNIRRLIWVYFILLLFEGALRKWVVPALSDPLLIIRDPVLLVIYVLAMRAKCFPRNKYIVSLGIIAALCWLTSIVVLIPYVSLKTVLLVTGYGFRSNFLHLPFIFVIPAVFDIEDVKRVGWWGMLIMIPMAFLMALQFRASPESFINRAAGLGEGQQLYTGGGKIRPPGTFSFISGPVFYLAAAAAFVLYGALRRETYKTWLVTAGGLAVVLGAAVSGSRGCVASVLLVVAAIGVIFIVRPQAVNQFGRYLVIGVIAALIVSRLPIFKEGMNVLSERFTTSAEAADTTIMKGMVDRVLSSFTEGLRFLDRMPWTGFGLGIGTMGGAHFLVGRSMFLLGSEAEWSRILLESGPIFGLAFLIWRTVLTCHIGWLSYKDLKRGEILSILIFFSAFLSLLNGQFGQPTSLGFAVVLNGLCLAAMQRPRSEKQQIPSSNGATELRPLPRQSEFARQLHARPDPADGLVDR